MPETETGSGYTTGEKLAGIIGAVLFLALLTISLDLATGGRLLGGKRKPCGCDDGEAAPDDGAS